MGTSGCDNGAHGPGPAQPSGLRDASAEPARTGFLCPTRGRFIVTAIEGWFSDRRHGSPQKFCSHTCRQRAYRRRRARDLAPTARRRSSPPAQARSGPTTRSVPEPQTQQGNIRRGSMKPPSQCQHVTRPRLQKLAAPKGRQLPHEPIAHGHWRNKPLCCHRAPPGRREPRCHVGQVLRHQESATTSLYLGAG